MPVAAVLPTAQHLVYFAVRGSERVQVPVQYRWDLTALFPSEAAWQKARESIVKRIPRMARYRDRLGVSGDTLAMSSAMRSVAPWGSTWIFAPEPSGVGMAMSTSMPFRGGRADTIPAAR